MQNSTTTKPGDVTELQLDYNFFSPFPRTDQTPLQSSVTVHRRPPGPITSHHRGPGPPPVPNANTTQGPPPAPRSAHMTQNPPHWIQHRDQQTAIHSVATEALDLRVMKQRDSGEGGIGMEKRKEKLEREALCVMCNKIEQDTCCGILDKL
ncbi:unnamed protein product [Pleuronectes platessa]|uniref:Uncharacterized protein n=1 Tax=Pleuronectes platessa TaxID=8262 RepID=A0A9N7VU70_PLEPL|nr:unnamed protein product [Pleuronectes platessa]